MIAPSFSIDASTNVCVSCCNLMRSVTLRFGHVRSLFLLNYCSSGNFTSVVASNGCRIIMMVDSLSISTILSSGFDVLNMFVTIITTQYYGCGAFIHEEMYCFNIFRFELWDVFFQQWRTVSHFHLELWRRRHGAKSCNVTDAVTHSTLWNWSLFHYREP